MTPPETPPQPDAQQASFADPSGSAIRVLGWAEEIHWPHLHDPILADLVLAGTIKARPSWQTIWWLDENLCQHSVDGPMDMERPRLEVVSRPGCEVLVHGIYRYELRLS